MESVVQVPPSELNPQGAVDTDDSSPDESGKSIIGQSVNWLVDDAVTRSAPYHEVRIVIFKPTASTCNCESSVPPLET